MKIMKDKELALVKEILAKLGASEEDQELVAEATELLKNSIGEMTEQEEFEDDAEYGYFQNEDD